jgi:TonB family protein
MSALLLAAAAAGFAPPALTKDAARQLQQNYPTAALRDGRSAAAVIDAQVDPKGRISNCKALSTYGDKALADSICQLAERVRIEPASVQGRSAYGVIRELIRFFLPQDQLGDKICAMHQPGDIEVQVNTLPAGKSALRVHANVLIDAAGKPRACNAPDAPPGYGDVACGQVSAITFGPLKDGDGKPVQYVRRVIVDFVTQPSAG